MVRPHPEPRSAGARQGFAGWPVSQSSTFGNPVPLVARFHQYRPPTTRSCSSTWHWGYAGPCGGCEVPAQRLPVAWESAGMNRHGGGPGSASGLYSGQGQVKITAGDLVTTRRWGYVIGDIEQCLGVVGARFRRPSPILWRSLVAHSLSRSLRSPSVDRGGNCWSTTAPSVIVRLHTAILT
jgi:hypothetical protein